MDNKSELSKLLFVLQREIVDSGHFQHVPLSTIAVCRADALVREHPKPPLSKGRWPAGPEGFVARRATAAFGGNLPVTFGASPLWARGPEVQRNIVEKQENNVP